MKNDTKNRIALGLSRLITAARRNGCRRSPVAPSEAAVAWPAPTSGPARPALSVRAADGAASASPATERDAPWSVGAAAAGAELFVRRWRHAPRMMLKPIQNR